MIGDKRDMNENNQRELAVKSVACCGLICALDSCYKNCDGCRSGKGCGDSQCFQKECCATRGLYGCWECYDFPCGKGYFASSNPSKGQFIGCVRYIKKAGIEDYVDSVIQNSGLGIKYGLNGTYADKSEDEVFSMLEKNENY